MRDSGGNVHDDDDLFVDGVGDEQDDELMGWGFDDVDDGIQVAIH